MRKYKESLLQAGAACPFPDDARTVIVDTFEVVIKGRDPLRFSIRTDADVAKLKDTPIVLKEDCEYQFRITFYVQREIVSGLTYVNVVKRKGIRVDKSQIMIGSYGPNLQPYQYVSPLETCPSGMLARGHYTAKTTFADDDKAQHLQFEYQFDIKKDWE
jgi:Rho GDP-dissociation inhibitor